MIASGFLLGGGLLALRYPADHDEASIAAETVVVERSAVTPASPLEQASIVSRGGAGDSYEPIASYVNRRATPTSRASGDWLQTSMSKPGDSDIGGMPPDDAETLTLDSASYAEIPVNPVPEQEILPQPEYQPFQVTTPITMPKPNPVFFEDRPSPPSLTGLMPVSDAVSGTVSGNVISPSATIQSVPSITMQPGVPVSGTVPVGTPRVSPPGASRLSTTTRARPVIQVSDTQEPETRRVAMPVVSPGRNIRNDVITAPAKTVIVP